jgi:hypothetical protein
MPKHEEDLKNFAKARITNGHSVADVAAALGGYSERYLYDVLRFPSKNLKLYKAIIGYCTDSISKTTQNGSPYKKNSEGTHV